MNSNARENLALVAIGWYTSLVAATVVTTYVVDLLGLLLILPLFAGDIYTVLWGDDRE